MVYSLLVDQIWFRLVNLEGYGFVGAQFLPEDIAELT